MASAKEIRTQIKSIGSTRKIIKAMEMVAASKLCQDYGIRAQYSVFECEITPAQWVNLKSALLEAYDADFDSLRFYYLGSNWKRKVEHHGTKQTPDALRDPLVL